MAMALILGFAFGFVGSVPIAGPIAAMVLERASQRRAREARALAFGAAVAESGYALLAFWGFTTVLARFPKVLPASRILGCAVAVALGVYFLARPHGNRSPPRPSSGGASWLLGFGITAVNPTLLVTWTAVITAVHSTGLLRTATIDALPFSAGVCAGIVAWFSVLVSLVCRFEKRVRPAWIVRAERGLGALFVLAGVVGAGRLWIHAAH